MSACPCPKHPTGCYGHPFQCGCADVEKTKDAEIASLRARLAEMEGWASCWHRVVQTIATVLDLPEPEAVTIAGLVRDKFAAAESRATSAEKTVLELREGLERLIATYGDFQDGNGDPCPDVVCARTLLAERRDG